MDVKVLDGGFSTQLSQHVGAKIDGDPLWTSRFLVTDPDAVFQTHVDFLRAGSDIIETNTYQASVTGFGQYLNLSIDESLELIKGAVDLAKNAVKLYTKERKIRDENRPLIAGSVGPYGAALHDGSEYSGSYGSTVSVTEIMDWHRLRIRTLVDAGCDLLALETIPCASEAEALVNLLREFPGIKAWLSFSCNQEGSSQTLVDGSGFRETVLACWNRAPTGQLLALGANCLAPGVVDALLEELSEQERVPMVVYPNSGEVYTVEKGWRYEGMKPPRPAKFVKRWLDLGAKYVGGCCRTGVKDVMEIKKEVNEWVAEKKNSNK